MDSIRHTALTQRSARFRGLLLLAAVALFSCNEGSYTGDLKELEATSAERMADPSSYTPEHRYLFPVEQGKKRFHAASFHNDEGLKLYGRKQYAQAAEEFRLAIVEDSVYLYPHYNLACTLSLLYGQGDESVKQELFDELWICLGLDPARIKQPEEWFLRQLETDADFDPLRETPEFGKLVVAAGDHKRTGSVPGPEWWLGEWTHRSSGSLLLLAEDGTLTLTEKVGGGDTTKTTTGRWQWMDKSGRLRLMPGSPLTYSSDKVALIEQDLSAGEIHFYTAGSQRYPVASFTKGSSPLARAMNLAGREGNLADAVALLAAGVLYSPADPEKGTFFRRALASGRPALIRLFLGRRGILPDYESWHILLKEDSPLYAGYRDRLAGELFEEAAANSRFTADRYRKVLASDITPVFAKEGDAPMGWGGSNRYICLGTGGTKAAFLIGDYVSAMPGSVYRIRIFDAETNTFTAEVSLGTDEPYEENLWLYLDPSDALIVRLMETEGEWVPLLEEQGIKPADRGVALKPFPVRVSGAPLTVSITRGEPAPDMPEMGNFYTWEIQWNGEPLAASKPEDPAFALPLFSLEPTGVLVLEGAVPAVIVFLSGTAWGFEGETDRILVPAGAVLPR